MTEITRGLKRGSNGIEGVGGGWQSWSIASERRLRANDEQQFTGQHGRALLIKHV
jgi:hypothetical protein